MERLELLRKVGSVVKNNSLGRDGIFMVMGDKVIIDGGVIVGVVKDVREFGKCDGFVTRWGNVERLLGFEKTRVERIGSGVRFVVNGFKVEIGDDTSLLVGFDDSVLESRGEVVIKMGLRDFYVVDDTVKLFVEDVGRMGVFSRVLCDGRDLYFVVQNKFLRMRVGGERGVRFSLPVFVWNVLGDCIENGIEGKVIIYKDEAGGEIVVVKGDGFKIVCGGEMNFGESVDEEIMKRWELKKEQLIRIGDLGMFKRLEEKGFFSFAGAFSDDVGFVDGQCVKVGGIGNVIVESEVVVKEVDKRLKGKMIKMPVKDWLLCLSAGKGDVFVRSDGWVFVVRNSELELQVVCLS